MRTSKNIFEMFLFLLFQRWTVAFGILDSKQISPNEETRDQKKKSSFQIELSVVKENVVIGL